MTLPALAVPRRVGGYRTPRRREERPLLRHYLTAPRITPEITHFWAKT